MSSCGVFNINSGDATGIRALKGCAFLQGFVRPEKTLESRLSTGAAASEEGASGIVPGLEVSPWGEGSVQCRQPRALGLPRLSPWALEQQAGDVFRKEPDSNYLTYCGLYGCCPTTELCCPSMEAATEGMQANGHFTLCSSKLRLLKKKQNWAMC